MIEKRNRKEIFRANKSMVMLIAVGAGFIAGALRARIMNRKFRSVHLRLVGLVVLTYLPQFFAFYLPATRSIFTDTWVPPVLVVSQALLLVFAWVNRKIPGFWLLGLGLLANFSAISLNGGMMPLAPQTAKRLVPPDMEADLRVGKRFGFTKDILLPREVTRLWFLGDIFILPEWMNYPLAFSIGDILIAVGAFWLLWELGGPHKSTLEVSP
jgi:hypothetical protein